MKPKIKLKPSVHMIIAIGTGMDTGAVDDKQPIIDSAVVSESERKRKIRGTGAATQGIYSRGPES